MTKDILIAQLKLGSTGNQILQILDAIVGESTDAESEVQEVEEIDF